MPERGFTITAEDLEAALGRGVMRAALPGVAQEEPTPEEVEATVVTLTLPGYATKIRATIGFVAPDGLAGDAEKPAETRREDGNEGEMVDPKESE